MNYSLLLLLVVLEERDYILLENSFVKNHNSTTQHPNQSFSWLTSSNPCYWRSWSYTNISTCFCARNIVPHVIGILDRNTFFIWIAVVWFSRMPIRVNFWAEVNRGSILKAVFKAVCTIWYTYLSVPINPQRYIGKPRIISCFDKCKILIVVHEVGKFLAVIATCL